MDMMENFESIVVSTVGGRHTRINSKSLKPVMILILISIDHDVLDTFFNKLKLQCETTVHGSRENVLQDEMGEQL